MLVFIVIMLHFISGISLYIYFDKTGVMKEAAKHGDGIWFPRPNDLIFYCLFISEFYWLMALFTFIENSINSYFDKKYK